MEGGSRAGERGEREACGDVEGDLEGGVSHPDSVALLVWVPRLSGGYPRDVVGQGCALPPRLAVGRRGAVPGRMSLDEVRVTQEGVVRTTSRIMWCANGAVVFSHHFLILLC